ncbi:MAG: ATP-binding protein [Lachnospiraceae bacterium]|nr:ATP-binding protein [Lachnospiraceae bacterium]
MISREQELEQLKRLNDSNQFEFLVMYGRRRVGKTTILQEFSRNHDVIFYSAQEKNDSLNLHDFSKTLQLHFDKQFIAPFPSWEDALTYITDKSTGRKTTLIIDEFPFMAGPNPSIKSMLQHEIDHHWSNRNLFLILCGSSVSFMLNDIMGYESPLYGRATSSMEVLPFDYLDSARFFPDYSPEEKLIAYGILGGIPRYLKEFSDEHSIQENIETRILENGAFLSDEPQMFLRMELREPNVYNSILEAVSRGYNKISKIADCIREDRGKCGKYISTLQTIRLIEKQVPCGEPETGEKTIYSLTDNFYRFWYRHIFTNKSYYELLGAPDAATEIMENISDFMGLAFENICKQYLIRQAKLKKLPFTPAYIGKWWGNNPVIRAQDDVDLLALDKKKTEGIFCECKFTNRPMPMEEYDDLITATQAFPENMKKHLLFISKNGFTAPVKKRADEEGAILMTAKDLFDDTRVKISKT